MKTWSLLLLPVAAGFCLSAYGVCLDNLTRQAPDDRYDIRETTLVDRATGLEWQRCPLGQTWLAEKTRCQLQPGETRLFTWGAALAAAGNGWRLPNKNELESLIDRACTGPAVNERALPDTALAGFWTSTPARHSGGFAWQVDFATGTLIAFPTTTQLSVRLVRDAAL